MKTARVGLDLKSRRPRFTELPLDVPREGGIDRVLLPVADHPAVVILPVFSAPPAHIDGRPYSGGIEVGGMAILQVSGPPVEDLAKRLNTRTLQFTSTLERDTFERFLLKIAYCFAISELGLDRIDTAYIVPSILGGPNDMGRWLGCDGEAQLGMDALHAVSCGVFESEIICRVRLFASYDAPEYVVTVGRATPAGSL